jgi:hypothetical protein
VEDALGRLVSADTRSQAVNAVQQLLYAAHQAGERSDRIWAWLATLTTAALHRSDYRFVARIGLGTLVWNGFYLQHDPAIGGYGLGPTPPDAELPLLLDCFEACTHLPEREVLSSDSRTIFDVESVRNWCQGGLSRLPLDEHLTAVARPTRSTDPAPALRNPALTQRPEAHEDEGHYVRKRRVFISYVHEDVMAVDRIAAALRAGGAEVWLDRTHLVPGDRWELAIRHAIRDGDAFLACFSPASGQRERSFMRKELLLAIDELQLRPHDRRWFIPVVLKPCSIPDHPIGGGQYLRELHYVDFSQDWETAIQQLLKAIFPDSTTNNS